MKRLLLLISAMILVLGSQGAAGLDRAHAPFPTQTAASAATRITARITLTVPHDDTELVVEGKTIPGRGTSRDFVTPPLETGITYRYTFTATWQPNIYTIIIRNRVVSFRAGEQLRVDLTVEDPNDRVRVSYVPTPSDVAEEMIKLARVGVTDVVYEPGCGDARITIAAVKGGARRGVGIDIDPERVAESRVRVKEAGLEGKIEIRLGDALDIQDLSAATVVFLYMGDHFNLLIRPSLWKELKVGARVVSHRFAMGDWKPDATVSINSLDGLEYELHLWTVTEELKRKMNGADAR
jgi:uncharacterized protein (TIGR03000 family)